MIEHRKTMNIQLFQEFVITYDNHIVHMNEYLSKQAISLLEVLILHHGKTVSRERLIDVLWESNDNPNSALKFNVFRLRKLLKNIPAFQDMAMIQTDKNGYHFDPEVAWDSDCHKFETLYECLSATKNYQLADYHMMRDLLRLYGGKLFYNYSSLWFMQKEEQFRSMYLRYIPSLCEFCMKDSRYEDVKTISGKALALEPSIESSYYYHILAYLQEGNYTLANEYYQKAIQMLVNEYEVELSDKMKILHQSIINNNNQKVLPEQIIKDFKTRVFNNGAFYCASDVFDYIFEQRLRDSKRLCADYYLYVFEIDYKNSYLLDDHMQKLKMSITTTLRSGDVFTKLNNSQYIALLTCPTEEMAHSIAQRVCNAFRSKTKKTADKIHYHMQKINT